MRWRLYKAIGFCFLLAFLGISYYFFGRYTGLYIPCVFHLVTGLYCPGCGVTRMSIALIEGDVIRAFQNNGAVLILMPFFIFEFFWYFYNYVQGKHKKMSKIHTFVVYVVLSVLILFGILRNLPYFEYLRPID